MPSWQDVYQYNIGQHLILHTGHGSEYPVEVIAHTALPCCMVIKWHGLQPLTTGDKSTICLKDLINVTIDTRDWTVEDT